MKIDEAQLIELITCLSDSITNNGNTYTHEARKKLLASIMSQQTDEVATVDQNAVNEIVLKYEKVDK